MRKQEIETELTRNLVINLSFSQNHNNVSGPWGHGNATNTAVKYCCVIFQTLVGEALIEAMLEATCMDWSCLGKDLTLSSTV